MVGRFVHAGLLEVNYPVKAHAKPITVADALFVAQVEPRVLELLPAALIKAPTMFTSTQDLPADLGEVVRKLRRAKKPPDFRGIAGDKLLYWLSRVGRKDKLPSPPRVVSIPSG